MHTPEEQKLLEKLASGRLDGMVGDEREYRRYHSILCGKMIRNGIPIFYTQQVPSGSVTKQGSISSPIVREEETFESDDRKLEFLQRFGWLINDEEVRAYSSRFKFSRKTGKDY